MRKTLEDVKHDITEWSNGKAELLSLEYKGVSQPLDIRCECGVIFQRPYMRLRIRQLVLCPDCINKHISEKMRENFDDVKRQIEEVGCEYVDGEFINHFSKLQIRCTCGKVFEREWKHFKEGQIRCWGCGVKQSAESRTMIEGAAQLMGNIRYNLHTWIEAIKAIYHNRCPITNSKDKISVHHLVSLNTIFKEVLSEFKIQDIKNVEELNDKKGIIKAVVDRHTLLSGIPIDYNIHKQFHREYRNGNNTPQQFNEFLINHYRMTLKEIQSQYVI